MEKLKILESWKEISEYLRHSIKTCQRWEKKFGLPVHRFDETVKGRVYADPAELEIWKREKLHLAEASDAGAPLFRSLAVLPIKNLSGNKEKDYLSEGITETLITELAQISAFRVISHQSVRQFIGTDKTTSEIAKMLQVEALVEGALLQVNDKIRLSINLIGAFPERHLWAQTLEHKETELPRLQHRIAHSIAEKAGVKLGTQLEKRLSTSQFVNPQAYEAFLRGKASVRRSFVQADIERALHYYEKALALEPDFAPALAEYAWCYAQLGFYSFLPPKDAFPLAREAAVKAMKLDPYLAEAYTVSGFVAFTFEWDWDKAGPLLKRALELNPSSYWANYYYLYFVTCMGWFDEVSKSRKNLLELDPLNPENHWTYGWSLFWERRYDEAVATFHRLLEMNPDDHWLRMALGIAYMCNGNPIQALGESEAARSGIPIGLDEQFDTLIAYVYAMAGQKKKAQETLDRWAEIGKHKYVNPVMLVPVYAGLENKEEALKWLEEGYRDRCPTMVWTKIAPFLDLIRDDPRFQDLMRRMNFMTT